MPLPIEDYALIGDCKTAALVGKDGSIDWLCLPRFDSSACFAALLGGPEHGRWAIAPRNANVRGSRRYIPGTLVLETKFESPDGAAVVLDFMPRGGPSNLVRLVIGQRGCLEFETEIIIRFDYGSSVPWVSRSDDGLIEAIAGPERLTLWTPLELRGADLKTVGNFSVAEGQSVPFVLTHTFSNLPAPSPANAHASVKQTENWWRAWSDRCPPVGRWTEPVRRSLLTLKALTYEPTGGMVAAATTSLPEAWGGTRNWDYRFCWLRDATFTLLAFMNLGYFDEALAWRDWLMRAVAGMPDQVQTMYGVGGERRLPEWELLWLPGYCGAGPVRIGNAAADQFQLDVFGEVADAMYQGIKANLVPPKRAWAIREALLNHLETVWHQPDEGIWEVRAGRRHFTHSKVMAWVAFDRAATAIEASIFNEASGRWRQVADEIHAEVCAKAFDSGMNSFVQSYGSDQIDASLLLIPLVGFLPADDARVRGTVQAIEERLLISDEFVLRYTDRNLDGLPPGEGAFLACSFWLVDNYVMMGRRDKAQNLFDRLLARCNDVGLLAEEIDPRSGRMLGNFPQAYSHVGLINSALNLARKFGPAEERAEDAMPSRPD